MSSPPHTAPEQSAQHSNNRRSYPLEENDFGIFPLEEYGDDKKTPHFHSPCKSEGFETESTYNGTDLERPPTAYSRASEHVVNRMTSRDDLVQK